MIYLPIRLLKSRSLARVPPDSSVVDRLIREYVDFTVQRQIACGMQLRHEDDDHLLCRIDCESSVEEASPVVFARRSQLGERALNAGHSEAQPEALLWTDLSELILRHEFDGLAAQQTCVADLAAVEHHLAEAGVVHRRGNQPGAARKQFLRTARRIVRGIYKRSFLDRSIRKAIQPFFRIVRVGSGEAV